MLCAYLSVVLHSFVHDERDSVSVGIQNSHHRFDARWFDGQNSFWSSDKVDDDDADAISTTHSTAKLQPGFGGLVDDGEFVDRSVVAWKPLGSSTSTLTFPRQFQNKGFHAVFCAFNPIRYDAPHTTKNQSAVNRNEFAFVFVAVFRWPKQMQMTSGATN